MPSLTFFYRFHYMAIILLQTDNKRNEAKGMVVCQKVNSHLVTTDRPNNIIAASEFLGSQLKLIPF